MFYNSKKKELFPLSYRDGTGPPSEGVVVSQDLDTRTALPSTEHLDLRDRFFETILTIIINCTHCAFKASEIIRTKYATLFLVQFSKDATVQLKG